MKAAKNRLIDLINAYSRLSLGSTCSGYIAHECQKVSERRFALKKYRRFNSLNLPTVLK
jgi:hypothetical protein